VTLTRTRIITGPARTHRVAVPSGYAQPSEYQAANIQIAEAAVPSGYPSPSGYASSGGYSTPAQAAAPSGYLQPSGGYKSADIQAAEVATPSGIAKIQAASASGYAQPSGYQPTNIQATPSGYAQPSGYDLPIARGSLAYATRYNQPSGYQPANTHTARIAARSGGFGYSQPITGYPVANIKVAQPSGRISQIHVPGVALPSEGSGLQYQAAGYSEAGFNGYIIGAYQIAQYAAPTGGYSGGETGYVRYDPPVMLVV